MRPRRAKARDRQLGERACEIATLERAAHERADDLCAVERDRLGRVFGTKGIFQREVLFRAHGGRGGRPSPPGVCRIGPTWGVPLDGVHGRRAPHAACAAPANTRASSSGAMVSGTRAESVMAARSARRRGGHPLGARRTAPNRCPASMAVSHRRSVRHALGPVAHEPARFAASAALAPSLPKRNSARPIAPAAECRRARTCRRAFMVRRRAIGPSLRDRETVCRPRSVRGPAAFAASACRRP